MTGHALDVGAVAEDILGLFADDGWDQPAVLADLAVTERAEGTSVSVSDARPLDGHPRNALAGVRAADIVDGLALVFEAWSTAGGQVMPWAPSQAADRIEVRSCVVVLRDGRHAAAVHERNGSTRRHDEAGPLVDTLLRVLGAPTPPPVGNAGALLALHTWLNVVTDFAEQARRPLTWAEAVDLLIPADDPDGTGEPGPAAGAAGSDGVVDAAGVVDALRQIGGAVPPADVYAIACTQNPDIGWHDVGSFARAVTASAFSTYADALDDTARQAAISVWQDLYADTGN